MAEMVAVPQNASDFVADALKGAFLSAQLVNYSKLVDYMEQPPLWQTWGVGLSVVCACSFSAPLGMTLLPFLNSRVYDRVMIFLIALGIGALSGSCVFVMIPQAFHLTAMEEVEYVSKSPLIITALYSLFTVDRLLQYALEYRRRSHAAQKVEEKTLTRILRESRRWGRERQTTEETVVDEEIDRPLPAYPTFKENRRELILILHFSELIQQPSKIMRGVSQWLSLYGIVYEDDLSRAAFSDSCMRGVSIGMAILSQQFPQELGTLAILINSGLGLRRTLLLNLLPTLLSFIGFSLGVLLNQVDESYDSYVFAVSSGMYLYIFLDTLIPEIRTSVNELIRSNLRESLVVTALHGAGIAGGVSFMFLMGRVGGAVLEEA